VIVYAEIKQREKRVIKPRGQEHAEKVKPAPAARRAPRGRKKVVAHDPAR
jgi:hypothetical protein